MDLLTELPERCRYRAAIGPEGVLWTQQDELMATLVELVSIAASKDTRLKHPLDLPRPRYPEASLAGPASTPAEVAAFFGVTYTPTPDDQQEG